MGKRHSVIYRALFYPVLFMTSFLCVICSLILPSIFKYLTYSYLDLHSELFKEHSWRIELIEELLIDARNDYIVACSIVSITEIDYNLTKAKN